MRIELFDARMLDPLVRFLEGNGARAESYLDRARIPAELIAEGGWVAKKQAYDLAYDIVRRSRCQDAIFAAYRSFDFGNLGPISHAMRCCKTVKESLEIGTRLGSTAYEGNEYFLHIDGETTWFCYREPRVISVGQTFINDMTMTVYFQLIRLLADADWRPERMFIRRDVFDRHRTVDGFEKCEVSWHQEFSALAFPTDFLSRRLPWSPPQYSFDASDAWLSAPNGTEPPVDAIYRLIAARFPYRKLPTLEQVAHMIDASPATLKRQLAAAGTSYRGLLDRLRFDAACEMLSRPDLSVSGIASEIGYSSTANFVRSFRRMTGLTPGDYRKQQSEGKGRPLVGQTALAQAELNGKAKTVAYLTSLGG